MNAMPIYDNGIEYAEPSAKHQTALELFRSKFARDRAKEAASAAANDDQEITDWLREERIEDLRILTTQHMAAGRTDEGHVAFARMKLEIADRSPQQIARMELARGIG
jgi:hypothetical protein